METHSSAAKAQRQPTVYVTAAMKRKLLTMAKRKRSKLYVLVDRLLKRAIETEEE